MSARYTATISHQSSVSSRSVWNPMRGISLGAPLSAVQWRGALEDGWTAEVTRLATDGTEECVLDALRSVQSCRESIGLPTFIHVHTPI